jgi:hypothetical protein
VVEVLVGVGEAKPESSCEHQLNYNSDKKYRFAEKRIKLVNLKKKYSMI